MVPVTVVTGFLGAGKTTLVNQWLTSVPRGDVAVIVNEHGDVGIDGALLAGRVEQLVEIAGGCVCCATQADLVRALDRLATSAAPPKRILIETSGAASPAGVLHAINGGARREAYALDGVVTIVDASRIEVLGEHDLAIEQVGYADVVVLSRSDACSAEQLVSAVNACATHNGAAVAVSAARGTLDDRTLPTLDALLERRREDFGVWKGAAPPRAASHVYESVSLVHDGEIDGDRFALFMEEQVARFAGRLFRTKGILAIENLDQRMIVQGVADLAEVTFGEAWGDTPRTSRFVVVGYGLDRKALERAFAECAAVPL